MTRRAVEPRIVEYDLRMQILRKEDPTWKFALGASPITEGVILRVATEDAEGYGYASGTPHMGSTGETMRSQLEFFRSSVIDQSAADIGPIMSGLDSRLRGAPQAKAAIECALFDLFARSLGVPLCSLLGGRYRDSVPVLRILAIKSPGEMAAQAAKLAGQGYRYLKIKVHGDVADDIARVAAIRKAVGPDVHLTIDANQSYTPKDAIAAINGMAPYDIDLVEQPVPVGDLEGLSLVTRSVPVTVEADEAAGSLAEVWDLVRHRRVDAVSLKIPKLGGLRNTIAAAQMCAAGGIRYRMGAAVGSQLLSGFAIHLACALPGCDYACELGEYARLLDDDFVGLEIADGRLALPDGAGVGVRPDPSLLKPAPAAAELMTKT